MPPSPIAFAAGGVGPTLPSGRGAPGAFGSVEGSKASPRLAGRTAPRRRGCGGLIFGTKQIVDRVAALLWFGRCRGGSRASGILEAEVDVLLKFLQLILQFAILELQLLDLTVQLANLAFETIDPHEQGRGIRLRLAGGVVADIGGRRAEILRDGNRARCADAASAGAAMQKRTAPRQAHVIERAQSWPLGQAFGEVLGEAIGQARGGVSKNLMERVPT